MRRAAPPTYCWSLCQRLPNLPKYLVRKSQTLQEVISISLKQWPKGSLRINPPVHEIALIHMAQLKISVVEVTAPFNSKSMVQ